MRTARFLAIVLLLVAVLAALAYVFRLPLAGWAVRAGMASAGLEHPQARVTALTINGARLEGVAAGPSGSQGFSFASVEADYRLMRLLSERKIDALRIGPGQLRARIDESGAISLPGVNTSGGSGGGGLPFDKLSLSDVALFIDTPQGAAKGDMSADYDAVNGGNAAFSLLAEHVTWNDVAVENAEIAGNVILSADGQASFNGVFSGDAETSGATARRINLTAKGAAASWREIAAGTTDKLAGAVTVNFAAPDIEWRDEQVRALVSAAQMETIFGEQLQRAALTGMLEAQFDENGVEVRILEDVAPLALTTPDGSSLTLRGQGEAPLYSRSATRELASLRFVLISDGVNARGGADYAREDGVWRLSAPIDIDEFNAPDISLDGSRIDVAATGEGQEFDADVSLKSGLRKAVIGRLQINDAPFNGAFRVHGDMAAKRATIVSKSDCFAIDGVRSRIAEQDLDIKMSGITLCNAEGPLAVYTWTGEMACTLSGELSAKSGSIRLGETHASGRPPVIRFDAQYHPARNTTSITGGIVNGAMTLNDVLDMSGVLGRFDFKLDAAAMHATANVDRLRMTQHITDPAQMLVFAPVLAAGQGELEGDKAEFSYTLTTPEGYRLGAGAGVHDMKTARGETTISIENLTFAPTGLQPNQISPALKGIVDAADGAMHGELVFNWAPKELTSTADFEFENISFGGPTRAVTRTRNLNGRVQLTDLLPIQTDGVQTITVAGVNLDALKLENGVMEFSMPGDDTFILQRGEFPWFGGAIGVYGAKASFAGQAEIPLRAQNIDLKQVLDYVKVEGLSGEGLLSGSLPLVFEDGRARIVNGVLKSEGPGVVRYTGAVSDQASQAGENADVAFDFLRNLRYSALEVTVEGALDGALKFGMRFEGVGDVSIRNGQLKDVPVIYRVNLAIENVDLLRKASLANAIKAQIERELNGEFQ
ncbi:intermembrane phospholipid transport protein YdbH family protein [Hyphococcus sp.]|uniref:intermembrane phospholipid transport protein YdbH family protein n=1 Tax=Hyphococcus sp. TaxID=2038636 RepID=UPI00208759F6|nr:MAG: hypothetical protein DHS20C04_07280 [Marinicaulis sp.]